MAKLLIYVSFLNFCDAIFTYLGLQLEMIVEANLLMSTIIHLNPVLFIAFKLLLSLMLLLFIWKVEFLKNKVFKYLTVSASILYSLVMIIHSYWLMDYIL